jgi:predicted MPP superfamily phosphohydrolase
LRNIITIVISCFFFSACESFETNPYAVILDSDEKNLTVIQLQKLEDIKLLITNKELVTIAFITDSQRALDEFEAGIRHINQNDSVDMIFHGGDMTDYATNIEYKKIAKILSQADAPFFTVFGNHDALGLGVSAYQNMFGSLDYSFKAWGHKFIFFNGNHLEFLNKPTNVPDFNFLEKELNDTDTDFTSIYLVSHMGPFHGEFGNTNSEKYHQLLLNNPKVRLSAHGHGHSHQFGELYGTGFNYLQVKNVKDRNYVLIHIEKDGAYEFERVFF